METKYRFVAARVFCAGVFTLVCGLVTSQHVVGQVRTKQPDRGTYESPRLEPVDVEPVGAARVPTNRPRRRRVSANPSPQPVDPDRRIVLRSVDQPHAVTRHESVHLDPLTDPQNADVSVQQTGGWSDETVIWDEAPILHDETCDGCSACDAGCEIGCDPYGCDSMGPRGGSWANSAFSLNRNEWFGSIELLLMFRSGTRLPPLVTTGPEDDPETSGELGQADTEVLFGDERVLRDLRAGGRLTLGTWIDPGCCRSLVMRGWFAGREKDGFSSDQSENSVLVRPFQNVSDDQAAEQDTQIVAFPDRATGSISVSASSDVFGADISARQPWIQRFGGTIDVLYGYQFMRMDEGLNIDGSSISRDDDFAPDGSVLAIDDQFDVENEFHGGQLGLASRYREGCWSFHSLAKVAFGSLRRSETLRGQTFTSIDGGNATDPNGLLVRSTNARETTDHTFGWVPELDFSLGWHRYPRFDVTFGYNIIAMTDAIQVGGLIDPDLRVNLSDPPTGQQSPDLRSRKQTFFVQGIHFGLQYVY